MLLSYGSVRVSSFKEKLSKLEEENWIDEPFEKSQLHIYLEIFGGWSDIWVKS